MACAPQIDLWQVNGQRLREIDFLVGEVDGHVKLWDTNAQLLADDTYQGGRRLAQKVDYYPNGQPRTEGMYLFAPRRNDLERRLWKPEDGHLHEAGARRAARRLDCLVSQWPEAVARRVQ